MFGQNRPRAVWQMDRHLDPFAAAACPRSVRTRRYDARMIDWAAIVAGLAVAVSGSAAWWSRKAARGQETSARKIEDGITFRWACEQAVSQDEKTRSAGIIVLSEMTRDERMDETQKRLVFAIRGAVVGEPAAYAHERRAETGDPGVETAT